MGGFWVVIAASGAKSEIEEAIAQSGLDALLKQ